MSKGLKWCCLSAIVCVAGCAYLTSEASNSPIVADSVRQARVSVSSDTLIVGVAPTENPLAGRARRHNRRVYRRMA